MTTKRVLAGMMLVLLACGPGADTPTERPDRPARPVRTAAEDQQAAAEALEVLKDSFVWGDSSRPAGDWDADAEACKARVAEDSNVRKGTHALVGIATFIKCIEASGWQQKAKTP